MRQDLLDAFNNILSNPELKNRFDKIKKPDDVYAVFKDAGYPGSSEELDQEIRAVVEEFVKSKKAREGDLSGVAGGKGSRFSKKMTASALALMGIASTASGNALYALNGNSFENAKSFVERQMKNPAVKNALGYGVTAVGAMSLGGILMWALMRNPKSPHLQKIYKYAMRANKALAEFEKAFTPQPASEPSDSTFLEDNIDTARENFRNEIRKIIEGMEKDKLFSDRWKDCEAGIYKDINSDTLNVETAYLRASTVFWCADIDDDTTAKLIKNDSEISRKIPWKRFYNRFIMVFDNTDLKRDYIVKEKEMFKIKFKEYNLSSNAINGSNVRDLFCKADENGANTASGGLQNITNREPILASVYTKIKDQDYEGTYDAFVKVLSKMGIAKRYKEKTYNNINGVFEWINQIINNSGTDVGDTFKNLYNFLVQEDGNKNRNFINLMKKLAKNDCIEYEDFSQVETQVQSFWEGCNNSCRNCSRIMLDFIKQFVVFGGLYGNKSNTNLGLTPQHVQNYQNWKQFHMAESNADKLQVLNSFNSGNLPINTEGLDAEDDFNEAVEQAIREAKAQAEDNLSELWRIDMFEEFFDNVKSNSISLSDIGINQYGLDIFD